MMKSLDSRLPSPALLKGEALWRALGFNNERAFLRARTRGALAGLRLYPVPDQSRGVYARKDDVLEFLTKNPGK